MKHLITAALLISGLTLAGIPAIAQDANSELTVITDIESLPTLSTDLSNPYITRSDSLAVDSAVDSVDSGEIEIIIPGYEQRVRGNDESSIPRSCPESLFLSTDPSRLNEDEGCGEAINPEVTGLTGSSRVHTTNSLEINRLGLVQVGDATLGVFYGEILAGDEAEEYLNGTTGDDRRHGGVFGAISF